jgi:ferritin-like metal-binding protein YciE
MEGLIDEGSEMTEEDSEGAVLDAGLIGAAQRVEHCEIAGCGIARFCRSVGNPSMFSFFEVTLAEGGDRRKTDQALRRDQRPGQRRRRGARRGRGRGHKKVAEQTQDRLDVAVRCDF